MQVGMLGPLDVRDAHGAPIDIPGARLRSVLGRLAVDAGRPVAATALIDAVWADSPPAEAVNALQTLVSRLRRALGDAAAVEQSPAGYRLAVDVEDVDVRRFERLVTYGARALREDDLPAALDALTDALELWRGQPFADVGGVDAGAARLDELHASARVDHATALLRDGRADTATGELEQLALERPLDERVAAGLVTSLAVAGRQADALRAYDRARLALADELGVDPSAELKAVHLAVLRGEIAPPEQPSVRRTNLRAQLTSFVGRDEEVARASKALAEHRLVTVVGPGGAGKTRLATEVGGSLAAHDGVWLAELASVTDPADVAQAVLTALDVRDKQLIDRRGLRSSQDAEGRLVDVLHDKATVVVLDNCEHVIDAAARLAEHLLGLCPELRILATSREPLGIVGEIVLAVPPLVQPAVEATAAVAVEYAAVRLFADRAAAARPDFTVDDTTVRTVVEIVRRLDGLPLAIELAAARLRTMPIADIAARLSDRFRLLTGGSRTALPRHRTLRAVVEWSWELLDDTERTLVERLAVFPAGLTAETAAQVCSDDAIPADDVDDLLSALVDKSLLQRVGDGQRLRMLETIREYGIERLADRGELPQMRDRHAEYFGALLSTAQPHLIGAGQLPWYDRLTVERENVLAALRFWCDTGDADRALRIAVDLGSFAMMLGNDADSGSWLEEALALDGAKDSPDYWVARALHAMSVASSGSDDAGPASEANLRDIAQHLVDVPLSTRPQGMLIRPAIAFFAADHELSAVMLEEGLASRNAWVRAASRMFRANLAENNGDVEGTATDVEQTLIEFRALGERWGLANTLGQLAMLHTLAGRLDDAEEAYAEAIALMRELNSQEDESFLIVRRADVAQRRGDTVRARRLMRDAVERSEASGPSVFTVFTLSMLAETERLDGNLDAARELHAQAWQRLGTLDREHPTQAHSYTIVEMLSARLALGDGDTEAAVAHARKAFASSLRSKDLPMMAAAGVLTAEFATALVSPSSGAEVLGAAARLRGSDDHTATEIVRLTATLRDALGDTGFEQAYARGKGLDRDAAMKRLDPAEAL